MAVGDRIGSARTAGFMRRINAIENTLTFTRTTPSHGSNFSVYNIATDRSGYIYISNSDPTDADGIRKINYAFSSNTTIASTGQADGETYAQPTMKGSESNLVVSDLIEDATHSASTARIQLLNLSGDFVRKDTAIQPDANTEYEYRAGGFLSDGRIVTAQLKWDITGSKTITESKLIIYSATLTLPSTILTVSNILGVPFVMPDDRIVVLNDDGTANETKIYNTSGSLLDSFAAITMSTSYGDRRIVSTDGASVIEFYTDGGVLTGTASPAGATSSSVANESGTLYCRIIVGGADDIINQFAPTSPQTTWYKYPTAGNDTGKVSLGTVDYGVSVPVAAALEDLRPHYFELRDMRAAIESVCTSYENPATAAAYTTSAGVNNIFRLGIDSGQDDWTTATVTHGARIREDYYNDIDLVLTQLEGSALV